MHPVFIVLLAYLTTLSDWPSPGHVANVTVNTRCVYKYDKLD